jgi:flagellar biosynthesis protein FlhB
MAEGEDRETRTEDPTPRRLEKAREEGRVVRSHAVSAAAVLVAGAVALSLGSAGIVERLELSLRLGLSFDPQALRDPAHFLAVARAVAGPGLAIAVSFVLLMAAIGFVADILVGGWVFSTQPLLPDASRISPVAGFARLFSRTALAEIVKALLRLAVVGAIGYWLIRAWAGQFIGLAADAWPRALGDAGYLWGRLFAALAIALAALAALEVPYQIWAHRDGLRMSRQELRDETRELDGSPQTKRRIRMLRRRLARLRMMAEVAKADVVIVNPQHYAAALSYRAGAMRAPRLVAKGAGLIALRIREVAGENGVPLVEAPPLARAICRYVELEDEIPPGLYPPVAEVLAYVYRLRAARETGRPAPPPPQDRRFDPPAEFAA